MLVASEKDSSIYYYDDKPAIDVLLTIHWMLLRAD
jgi:hypothetical protein